MKKIILIRHGIYGLDGRLDEWGHQQVNALAEKLPVHLAGLSGYILTSPSPRALDSAEMLRARFGFGIEKRQILLVDQLHKPKFPGLWQVIKAKEKVADVLLLMTHMEYVDEFPNYFSIKEWDLPAAFGPQKSNYASAFVIDCLARTLVEVV